MDKRNVAVVNEVETMDKPDCFAWLSEKKCNALVEKKCYGCNFYKQRNAVNNYKEYIDLELRKGIKSKNNSN